MEHQRTRLLFAIILLSPFTVLIPFTASGSNNSTTLVASNVTTISYTTANMTTYYASSNGTTLGEKALGFPPRVIGFIAPKGRCSQFLLPVTVTSNTALNLLVKSNQPVNLYVLPTYAFQTSPNGCGVNVNPILQEINFTIFPLEWTATANGTYYLLFTGPTAVILLQDNGSRQPVLQSATITFPTSTSTSLWLTSETKTTTFTTTTNPTPSLSLPATPVSAQTIGIITLIALLAIVIPAVYKKQSQQSNQRMNASTRRWNTALSRIIPV